MRRAEGKRQREGSLGQMRKEHIPFSLSTLVRYVSSPLLVSLVNPPIRSGSLSSSRTEHMAPYVYTGLRPGRLSTTHARTYHPSRRIRCTYIPIALALSRQQSRIARYNVATWLQLHTGENSHTRDHCSSCKRNSAFRVASAAGSVLARTLRPKKPYGRRTDRHAYHSLITDRNSRYTSTRACRFARCTRHRHPESIATTLD